MTKNHKEDWGESKHTFESIFDKKDSFFSKQLKRRLEMATPFVAQAIVFGTVFFIWAVTFAIVQ